MPTYGTAVIVKVKEGVNLSRDTQERPEFWDGVDYVQRLVKRSVTPIFGSVSEGGCHRKRVR